MVPEELGIDGGRANMKGREYDPEGKSNGCDMSGAIPPPSALLDP
eukprot:CAMPEP_0176460878 /NCGR_PEP_ID=MMETSP0127-20121128/34285_1 /TAXON_ID=938130 /ORGANISM="Platyophrya macrostoma, Strain WH" /LENGTH=44 /DNA_ID= /DNA_START= /DNA_END= /DNA_ORIENTATION=